MTINIFVLKGDLNRENRSGAFLYLSGIYDHVCKILLSYGIKINLKLHFWHENVRISIYTRHCYVRHFITLLKSVNH